MIYCCSNERATRPASSVGNPGIYTPLLRSKKRMLILSQHVLNRATVSKVVYFFVVYWFSLKNFMYVQTSSFARIRRFGSWVRARRGLALSHAFSRPLTKLMAQRRSQRRSWCSTYWW